MQKMILIGTSLAEIIYCNVKTEQNIEKNKRNFVKLNYFYKMFTKLIKFMLQTYYIDFKLSKYNISLI